ncbi:glycosyltransferase family 8 protein [Enterococcus viikkiensis]|uniref:glycosyltransferase family 8 protein n=1 Tax=Enterococcus viikkiensis TaxID=930854 RepID=UPI0010F7B2F9|nr:glycosyltransferase family 8 protein [Enterococcus viikkiensis]
MFSNQKELPIVTASDENYAPFLSVMIRTLLEHTNRMTPIHFYIIDDDLSMESKRKLKQTVQLYSTKAAIEFMTVNKETYKDFLVSDHITTTAYYRISLPKTFKNSGYEKILYIDADTFILDDVTKLYQTDLENKTIGAIIDPGQTKALARLGIDSKDYYFNSGVMVIDIKRWNQRNITEKTIDYLKNNRDKIIYHDQDALNAVLYEDWTQIHPRWSMQSSLITDKHPAPTLYHKKLYAEGRANPAIVHFTGHDKPWNTLTGHPFQDAYMKVLQESVFEKVVNVR